MIHLEIQRNKEEKIFNDLNYKLEYMKENHPELNIIAIFLQGSQNYGLDDENSDIDTKAFCIPSLTSLIEGKKMVSKIYVLPDNSHIEVKDIRLLPELLRKQNPSYLEILSTDYYLLSNEKSGQEFMNILGKYKKYIFKRFAYENDNPNCATYPKFGDIDNSVFENLRKNVNDFVKQTIINNIKKNKEESRC